MKKELALITAAELSLVDKSALNEKQLQFILKRTPAQYVRQRPAKGGGQWEYVSGGYVRKCLNLMFGFDWSFEILDEKILFDEAIVKGKLIVNTGEKTITKTQFGNKDIAYRKQTDAAGNRIPLSIGNDLKAAATDCLKKCAAELGIAADIYNKEDFKEVIIQAKDELLEQLVDLFDMKDHALTVQERNRIAMIIANKETTSYLKAIEILKGK